MKTSQWLIALLALAAMVFVVTFVMNYYSTGDPNKGPSPSNDDNALRLTFPARKIPGEDAPVPECELDTPGSQDFWFRNDNDQDVKVGINWKNCKCSSVHLFVMSDEWKERAAAILAARVARGPYGALDLLRAAGADDRELTRLADKVASVSLKEGEEATVPARAVGRVQLRWSGPKEGPQRLTAELWQSNRSAKLALETRVLFVPALRIPKLLSQLELRDSVDLKQPLQLSFICYTSTRPALKLDVEWTDAKTGADPFTIGKPVPLSAKEMADLERGLNENEEFGRVKVAYKVPITLREFVEDKAGNKVYFNVGPFRRRLKVKAEGIDAEKEVVVKGKVKGVVTFDGAQEFDFGTFTRGQKQPGKYIILRAEEEGLKLELDQARLPDFLAVELKTDPDDARAWRLEADLVTKKARSAFGGEDDVGDHAIYLKAIEPSRPLRYIRIPVKGSPT
jgi:hypothetical protein